VDSFFLYFFSFSVGGVLAYYICPVSYRVKIVLPALNILFIYSLIRVPWALFPLTFFLLLGYAGVRTVGAFRLKGLFLIFLAFILAVFIYLKKYAFIPQPYFIKWPYTVLGMSYILFRMIQLLVDVYQGEIKEKISLASFLNFSCNFFTFLSGPIQLYQEYRKQEIQASQEILNKDEYLKRFFKFMKGFIYGYIRVSVIAVFCLGLQADYVSSLKSSFDSGTGLMICRSYLPATFLYTLYLYFNFSGYMSIVTGVAGSLGFNIPENFNKPFESHSFLELWSRWHMTLSNWFKVYIFNPLIKFLAYRWPDLRLVPYHGVCAYFITFMLMGFWHGTSYVFLIYGLILGSGAAINKLFDVLMRKNFKETYKKMTGHQLIALIGGALTFSYFSIGLTSFWFDFKNWSILMGKIGILGFLAVLMGGTFCWVLLLYAGGIMQRWWVELSNNLSERYVKRHIITY
jgi:alginate O-acetyltransferase complex protein AlgI